MAELGGFAVLALFAYGAWVAYKIPLPEEPTPEPVRFDPPIETVDDFLSGEELLDEFLAVEVDAFIAECLGETA